ncbi:hypothetical protein [Alteribacillus bidgolensis]|uniref:hypothetical protein n=1 Tax=Alteribacillus bidgolensis TaxID=930129 RepID=UPI0014731245|nr:hypothetical protein [Alteribacillus bidgolensis]
MNEKAKEKANENAAFQERLELILDEDTQKEIEENIEPVGLKQVFKIYFFRYINL